MENFNEYWKKHESDYVMSAKDFAMADFDIINRGQFQAHIDINPDDDFSLDCGNETVIYGKTKKDLTSNVIDFLKSAKLTYVKKWTIIVGSDTNHGDYGHTWETIKNEAIQQLKNGETSIFTGGNQTIEINISEASLYLKDKPNSHQRKRKM